MGDLFLLLFLISIVAVIIGLIKPSIVIRWGEERNRKRVLRTYIPAILITFILFCISVPSFPSNSQSANTQKTYEQSKNATDNAIGKTFEAKQDLDHNQDSNEIALQPVSGHLKVHYIDVGQADSILIQNGSYAMLIDAGNNDDSSLVTSYIRQQGIKKLDYVVGTHPHEDHIGGLDNVINSFAVGKIYIPKVTHTSKSFEDLVIAIKNIGLKATTPIPNTSFQLGDATCTILAPNNGTYDDLNNYSIVLKVIYGNNSFLFNGDAEDVSEGEMLAKRYDLSANVLKIGHHGSSSSTTNLFLNSVNPQYAVICVGSDNTYGHPRTETMSKLKSKGIIVYRTDECGTIVATSDGKSITFNCNPGDYSYGGTGGSSQVNNANSTTHQAAPVVTTTSTSETSPTKYIGNKNSKKFHLPSCGTLPAQKNQVYFTSREEAIKQGYVPCKNCEP